MKEVDAKKLNELLHDDDHNEELIDVRTPSEFKSGHIAEAENVPLSSVNEAVEELKKVGTVYVTCGSGVRSEQACKILQEQGVNVVNLHGGMASWVRAGLHTVSAGGRKVIPIIRQVMIVAGSLVVTGILLGYFASPYWNLLSLFIGAGLLFAGLTGVCTLSKILSKMPWNK